MLPEPGGCRRFCRSPQARGRPPAGDTRGSAFWSCPPGSSAVCVGGGEGGLQVLLVEHWRDDIHCLLELVKVPAAARRALGRAGGSPTAWALRAHTHCAIVVLVRLLEEALKITLEHVPAQPSKLVCRGARSDWVPRGAHIDCFLLACACESRFSASSTLDMKSSRPLFSALCLSSATRFCAAGSAASSAGRCWATGIAALMAASSASASLAF